MFYRKLTIPELHQTGVLYPGKNYKYILLEDIRYYSKRYGKWITCKTGMLSDGATSAIDFDPEAFFLHDRLCEDGTFADGTPCTNWQASTVYSSVLWKNKRWFQAIYRWPATWLGGGGKCKDVGMW